MYTHNHVDKYKTISQSRLTEKCIVHAARKVNWWKYRRHAKCTLHMVCLEQSKLYVLQNVIGVIYLNGQWPYWPTTLFEICPHKPNAMIKWIKMVYFGLASCQLFQLTGETFVLTWKWWSVLHMLRLLTRSWLLHQSAFGLVIDTFCPRIHVEEFILSLPLLSWDLSSWYHLVISFSLLSSYASISSRNHSNIHKCWQTHFKLVFSQALSALKSV